MFKEVGLLGAAVACYLLALFFQNALGLADTVGWVIGGVLLLAVGFLTKFSIGSFLLFVLFITHALGWGGRVGNGRQWIQNITGNILTPAQGKILFVFTSLLMFAFRFCAHFIEEQAQGVAGRASFDLFDFRGDWPLHGKWRDHFRGSDACTRRVRHRQDILLADDVGGGRLTAFPAQAPSQCRSWEALG